MNFNLRPVHAETINRNDYAEFNPFAGDHVETYYEGKDGAYYYEGKDGLTFYDGDEFDHFIGKLIKNRRRRKDEKHAVKMDKKRAKNEIKLARAYAIRTKADGKKIESEAKGTLAEQGIAAPTIGSQIVGAATGIIGAFKGGGGAGSAPETMGDSIGAAQGSAESGYAVDSGGNIVRRGGDTGGNYGAGADTATTKKNKTMLIVAGVVVALIVMVALFMKKKK